MPREKLPKDMKKVPVTVTLDPPVKAHIKKMAAKSRKTLSAYLNDHHDPKTP